MRRRSLNWGPEIVQLLLPHRRPFLMVDTVTAFSVDPAPQLRARRAISANEPVFDGHFPQMALWPGVYTIEALAQSCNLLFALKGITDAHADGISGLSKDLSRLSAALRMEPVPGGMTDLEGQLERLQSVTAFGVLVSVDIKLKQPVFAGDTLDLHVALADTVQGMWRVRAEAAVGPKVVASGLLTVMPRPVPPSFRT